MIKLKLIMHRKFQEYNIIIQVETDNQDYIPL